MLQSTPQTQNVTPETFGATQLEWEHRVGVHRRCEHSHYLAFKSQHSITFGNTLLTCTKKGKTWIPKADPTAFAVDPLTVTLMKEQIEDVLRFQKHKLPTSFQLGFAVTWELTQNTRSVEETPQHTFKQNNYDSSWCWSWETQMWFWNEFRKALAAGTP